MLEEVKQFMVVMGQEFPDTPAIPSEAIQDLRKELIREENIELANAARVNNIVEVADALCDLQYVLSGAIIAYGFTPELFTELFKEVHRSNMSKACVSIEDATESVEVYHKKGIVTHINQVGEFYTIVRSSDDKVLKGINYSNPVLWPILNRHGVE